MKYLGFVLLVLSGYVMAEEVYYCSDNTNGATGFKKKDGQYRQINFHEAKFKMKLQDDGNIAIDSSSFGNDDGGAYIYLCSTVFNKNHKSCVHKNHSMGHINFNQDNGRYVRFFGYGYVFGDEDTVSTSIGTCTKF